MDYLRSDAGPWQRRFQITALGIAIALVGLTAVLRPSTAHADIPYPFEFMRAIENYVAANQPPSGGPCSARPGVVSFRDHLNWLIQRRPRAEILDCSDPDSDHVEGRALDYWIHAEDDPWTGIKILFGHILKTDRYGNSHALGRRFGLTYIIWNSKMFRFYDPGRGWAQYKNCVPGDSRKTFCHINHIHFSFSHRGAAKQTSWWTTTLRKRTLAFCEPRGAAVSVNLEAWVYAGYGPTVRIKKINGYDTQSELADSPWRVQAAGRTFSATQPLSLFATNPRPRARVPAYNGYCYVNLY